MEWLVHLVDGSSVTVSAADERDAVLEAGTLLGQDVGHLVTEVEAL